MSKTFFAFDQASDSITMSANRFAEMLKNAQSFGERLGRGSVAMDGGRHRPATDAELAQRASSFPDGDRLAGGSASRAASGVAEKPMYPHGGRTTPRAA